jgi:drug/metabolite transporter (DMT)-like permease
MPRNLKFLSKIFTVAYLGLFISQLIWAAAVPVIKMTLEYIPPFTFLFLRFLIVCILILPYTLYMLQNVKIDKRDYFNLIMMGLFSQTSLGLLFLGLNYTNTMDAVIIGILGPLLSMAAGHYFYNDKMNTMVKFGMILTIIGTLCVAFEPLLSGKVDDIPVLYRLYGNFLVVLNNVVFLVYVIWSKISFGQTTKIVKKTLHFIHLRPMQKEYSPITVTTLSFYVGLITMLPLALLENMGVLGDIRGREIMYLSAKPIIGLFYMAVFSSIVAYYIFEWTLKKVTVSDTAVFGYLSPILTIPFSYLILNELPTKYAVFGGFIIALGVLITEVAAHTHERRKKLAELADTA